MYTDSYEDWQFIFWTVFWWINTITLLSIALFGLWKYWKRRKVYPIKFREPILVIVIQILQLKATFSLGLPLLGFVNARFNCFGYTLATAESMVVMALITLRFALLYFWSLITNLAMEFHSGHETLKNKRTKAEIKAMKNEWVLRNRHRFNRKFWMWAVFVYAVLLCAIPWSYVTFSIPGYITSNFQDDTCQVAITNIVFFYQVYGAFTVIQIGFLWLKVRKIPENFRLVEELELVTYTGCYILMLNGGRIILNLLIPDAFTRFLESYRYTLLGTFFVASVPNYWFAYTQLYLAVRWSYEHERAVSFHERKSITDYSSKDSSIHPTEWQRQQFLELIEDPIGSQYFKEFLRKEFSVENFLFWKTVEKFKKMYSGDGYDEILLQKHVLKIYNHFMSSFSPLMINISSQCKERIQQRLGIKDILPSRGFSSKKPVITNVATNPLADHVDDVKLDEVDEESSLEYPSISVAVCSPLNPDEPIDNTVFDEAEREIFTLMFTDSFSRYRLSEEYQEFADRKAKEVIEAPKNSTYSEKIIAPNLFKMNV